MSVWAKGSKKKNGKEGNERDEGGLSFEGEQGFKECFRHVRVFVWRVMGWDGSFFLPACMGLYSFFLGWRRSFRIFD